MIFCPLLPTTNYYSVITAKRPQIFNYHHQYYLNDQRLHRLEAKQDQLLYFRFSLGPLEKSDDNPLKGPAAETTFGGQSTYVLPVEGKKDCFIFLADRWNPANLTDSRYLWLPVQLKNDKPELNGQTPGAWIFLTAISNAKGTKSIFVLYAD